MPLQPSKSSYFDSWEDLLHWLAQANENELMTVFVWSKEQQELGCDLARLEQVRKETFEHLVRRTRERLKHFLVQRVHCKDSDLAEDIVQQVLIKLYLRAEQFDPRRSFWGWLYRIARNEYIDALRRQRPGDVGIGQTGDVEDEMNRWMANLTHPAQGPESGMIERERRQELERAIERLPAMQRTIIRLKAEGIKGKEIARRLGISQAYVSQLFHEAGEILREAVQ